jgi:UDP-N-acetylglucosamine 2-epimerase (non-hydrolysing)
MKHRQMAAGLDVVGKLGLEPGKYATLTMHRPSNVDDRDIL